MYLYDIGYGTCEESEYNQYFHANKYTKEELADIIIQCMCEVIEWYTGRFDENGHHDPLIFVNKKGVSFQELMGDDHFHEFLKNKGFFPAEFTATFNGFGWASAMEPGDWDSYTGDEDHSYQNKIKEFCEKKNIIIEQYTDKDGDNDNYRLNWKK